MEIGIGKIIFASFIVIAFDFLLYHRYMSQNGSSHYHYIEGNAEETTNHSTSLHNTTRTIVKVKVLDKKLKLKIAANKKPTSLKENHWLKKKLSIDPTIYKFYRQRYRSPIVVEQYKLLWFLNPKVASTSTKFLLARMSNQTFDPLTTKEEDIEFKKLNDYSSWKAKHILGSPHWTRVIILRDPKERILSAYLGKEERYHHPPRKNKNSYFKINCCTKTYAQKLISKITNDCYHHNFTFDEFIAVTRRGCRDMHWTRQYDIVEDYRIINFAINFHNLANDTKGLLDKLGVWDKFGRSGWGVNGTSAVFEENTFHRSDSQTRYDEFYTWKTKQEVEFIYSRDYEMIRNLVPNMNIT